jgi:transcriptional regulator with PAS, ATPase and Fis domain
LFGYEKGAFTGAFRSKPGKFEMANGGTILLDEIGDMDLKLQAKLLQVLQDSEFHRLGGRDAVQVDVRVVVATHRDLEKGIAEGWFREDLYYRLSVVTVAVPALRQRREEILPLAQHFLVKHRQPGYEVPGIPLALKTALVAYDWPGNVRELENVIRKLLVFNDAEMIIADLRTSQERRQPSRAGAWRAAAAGGSPDPCAPDAESTTALATPATLEAAPLETAPLETAAPLREIEPEATFERRQAVGGSSYASAQTALAEEAGPGGWSERLSELERLVVALIPSANGHPPTTGPTESTIESRSESRPVSPLDKVDEEAREHERQAILSALQRTNWNRRKAAAMLRVDYKGLLYRMKKLEIGSTSGDEVE